MTRGIYFFDYGCTLEVGAKFIGCSRSRLVLISLRSWLKPIIKLFGPFPDLLRLNAFTIVNYCRLVAETWTITSKFTVIFTHCVTASLVHDLDGFKGCFCISDVLSKSKLSQQLSTILCFWVLHLCLFQSFHFLSLIMLLLNFIMKLWILLVAFLNNHIDKIAGKYWYHNNVQKLQILQDVTLLLRAISINWLINIIYQTLIGCKVKQPSFSF